MQHVTVSTWGAVRPTSGLAPCPYVSFGNLSNDGLVGPAAAGTLGETKNSVQTDRDGSTLTECFPFLSTRG